MGNATFYKNLCFIFISNFCSDKYLASYDQHVRGMHTENHLSLNGPFYKFSLYQGCTVSFCALIFLFTTSVFSIQTLVFYFDNNQTTALLRKWLLIHILPEYDPLNTQGLSVSILYTHS